jgi:large subunit ribosomal protein L7/L12
MAEIANLVEELSKLTVIEAADLVKQLETKWGVSAAAPVAVAAASAPAAGAAAPAAAAKDTFDVILASVPADKKIAVIKAVREVKPASASPKPRPWWKARPSRCSKARTKPTPTTPKRSSKKLAQKSKSSNISIGTAFLERRSNPIFLRKFESYETVKIENLL